MTVMAIVPFSPKPFAMLSCFSYDDDGGDFMMTIMTKTFCMTHKTWDKIEAENMRNEEKSTFALASIARLCFI